MLVTLVWCINYQKRQKWKQKSRGTFLLYILHIYNILLGLSAGFLLLWNTISKMCCTNLAFLHFMVIYRHQINKFSWNYDWKRRSIKPVSPCGALWGGIQDLWQFFPTRNQFQLNSTLLDHETLPTHKLSNLCNCNPCALQYSSGVLQHSIRRWRVSVWGREQMQGWASVLQVRWTSVGTNLTLISVKNFLNFSYQQTPLLGPMFLL